MLANEPYIATDPELGEMHLRAQTLLSAFNSSLPDQLEERRETIQVLFGSIGQTFEVKPTFRCDYGCHIYAKENLYINYDCIILDCNYVYLGSNVLLGPRVQIYTAYHPLDPEMREAELENGGSCHNWRSRLARWWSNCLSRSDGWRQHHYWRRQHRDQKYPRQRLCRRKSLSGH